MADYLSSAEWKKVVKDHKDLKAPGIAVQLDAFQKAEGKKDLLEQIAALNELLDEVKGAKAKNAKDKELVEYLDGITKDAKKKVGTLETQAAKKAKQEEAEQREKDAAEELPEEDAKDKELLAMVKRALTANRDQPLRYAILQQSAKEGALVLGKATVPADKIQAAREKSGGGRIVSRGICFNENGKLIFESPREAPATLPQATRLFVFRDTGKKINPIFRVASDVEDEMAGGEGAAKTTSQSTTKQTANPVAEKTAGTTAEKTSAQAEGKAQEQQPQAEKQNGAALAAVWNRKVFALTPQLKIALAEKTPLAADVQRDFNAARELAGKQNYAEAIAIVDQIAATLRAAPKSEPTATATEPATAETPPEETGRKLGPRVAFTKARLEWVQAQDRARSELAKLQSDLEKSLPEESELATALGETLNWYGENIVDALDKGLQARDPAERRKANGEALELVKECRSGVSADDFLDFLKSYPGVPVDLKGILSQALVKMEGQLKV